MIATLFGILAFLVLGLIGVFRGRDANGIIYGASLVSV